MIIEVNDYTWSLTDFLPSVQALYYKAVKEALCNTGMLINYGPRSEAEWESAINSLREQVTKAYRESRQSRCVRAWVGNMVLGDAVR